MLAFGNSSTLSQLQSDDGGKLQVKATGHEKNRIMRGNQENRMRPKFKTVHVV